MNEYIYVYACFTLVNSTVLNNFKLISLSFLIHTVIYTFLYENYNLLLQCHALSAPETNFGQ